jgi:hypothetical protein
MKLQSFLTLSGDKKSKNFQKITLKLILPAGEAKNNSIIGPLLGQHQINIMSFCNEFNSKSLLKYNIGVLLKIYVFLKKDKTYTIMIDNPPLSFLLNQIVERKNDIKFFNITLLYDIVQILSFFLGKDLRATSLLLLGYLNSGKKTYKYKLLY